MRPAEERFWPKVQRGSEDECWPWLAGRFGDGYGAFRLGGRGSLSARAPRAAWMFTYGDIPEGLLVCHHCDNPLCVNPRHLFLGTPKDNMLDMIRKRREVTTPGEKNGMAKMDDGLVREIREAWSAGGVTQRQLASRYGVNQSQISRVVSRDRWKHIA